MLGGWTRTDSQKSSWKVTLPAQDHLKDGDIVGNLPLTKRRKDSVRIKSSTGLQEVE